MAAASRLSRRLPLMIASLLLAFLLWILVIAEAKIEAGFMVPLIFDNIPASVVIDGHPMGSVYVQIRGSKQAVESVLPQQIGAHVDLSGATPGDEFVQITPQNIVLPQGITVLGVYPPYLDLKFLAKKPVPIKVRTVGKPAGGYEVKEITTIPLEVEVLGPLHRVESIKQVETYPLAIGGLMKSRTIKPQFVQPGDDIRLLQLKPTEVTVHVVAKRLEKTFRDLPVQAGESEGTISPAAVSVLIEGEYNRVKELQKEQISVEVDWEAVGDDPTMRKLRVLAPEGFSARSIKPEQVKVE